MNQLLHDRINRGLDKLDLEEKYPPKQHYTEWIEYLEITGASFECIRLFKLDHAPQVTSPACIRWGELCAVLGHEIPPWVLAAMGCESESGNYSRESLARLGLELQSMASRLAASLSK